jgi:hypothetical protein
MYHALGDRLPRDDFPVVAVDLGDLFRDYPFATAYLRRPVVLLKDDDELTLPWEDEPADLGRLAEMREAYIIYDPRARLCRADAVPLPDWTFDRIAVCRVSARDLLRFRGGVVPPNSPQ